MPIASRRSRRSADQATVQAQLKQEADALLLIKGLAYLQEQAQLAELAPAARILQTAIEDLVYWAAERATDRSPNETFIDRQLFASGLFPAAGLALRCQALRGQQRKLVAGLLGLTVNS